MANDLKSVWQILQPQVHDLNEILVTPANQKRYQNDIDGNKFGHTKLYLYLFTLILTIYSQGYINTNTFAAPFAIAASEHPEDRWWARQRIFEGIVTETSDVPNVWQKRIICSQ